MGIMNHVLTLLRTASRLLIGMALLTGLLYPFLVTLIAQGLFPRQANGSLVTNGTRVVGSALLAQGNAGDRYFDPRPSSTAYGAFPSGGSNASPTSLALGAAALERRRQFLERNKLPDSTVVPAEMLFASASGFDPHIGPEAALLQVTRVAAARGLSGRAAEIVRLIHGRVEAPVAGFLGEPRVNVLELNCALDLLR
jgi:K+-transporting ATPase ATPase C chain